MKSKEKIALVGLGMVGKPVAKVLGIKRKDCFDIKDKKVWGYDYYILCLPSPSLEEGYNNYSFRSYRKIQDISAIRSWLTDIEKNDRKSTVILRSTVLPGTTARLIREFKLKIVHVPEFLTEKSALRDEMNPEFLIIGSKDKKLSRTVARIFLKRITPRKVILTDSTTAELIKYTMNSFFALKVVFANQIYDVAKQVKADYERIPEVLTFHKWGSKNGWKVLDKGGRGAGGHCLPKDTGVFADTFDIPLIKKMVDINTYLLEETHKK